jgi:uncharacterized phiE125 gp8 family phage protein
MGIQITIPPTSEPVTVTDVANHCRVVNDADLGRLNSMALAAREWCEGYLGQQIMPATYLWTIDRFINLYLYQTSLWTQQIWPWYFQSQSLVGNRLPNTWYMLWPPRNPLRSVTSITYIDLNGATQTLDPAKYIIDTSGPQGRISPAFGLYWPPTQMRIDAVNVTFTAGYSTVPEAIKLAICQIAAAWFDQREAITFDQPMEIPIGAKTLLDSCATGRYIVL